LYEHPQTTEFDPSIAKALAAAAAGADGAEGQGICRLLPFMWLNLPITIVLVFQMTEKKMISGLTLQVQSLRMSLLPWTHLMVRTAPILTTALALSVWICPSFRIQQVT
jgi:hypothetical protein